MTSTWNACSLIDPESKTKQEICQTTKDIIEATGDVNITVYQITSMPVLNQHPDCANYVVAMYGNVLLRRDMLKFNK